MNTIASALTESMRLPDGTDKRDGNPNAVYTVLEDGPITHYMTIGMIDVWWESLAPSERAEVCERSINRYSEAEEAEAMLAAIRNPLERIVAGAELLIQRNTARMDAPLRHHPQRMCIERAYFNGTQTAEA